MLDEAAMLKRSRFLSNLTWLQSTDSFPFFFSQPFTAARNWREPILQKFWTERPSIGALVKMGWDSFEAKPNDEDNMEVLKSRATVHAMASYFILYLQEKQKLSAVFNMFREVDINKIEDDPRAQNIKLLESALNQSIDKINQDFGIWFAGLGKPNR